MTETSAPEDEAREDALRDAAARAYDEGRFDDAFRDFHASILSCALRLFREEGIVFARPKGDITPTELITGLAAAANTELRERGDEASNKISSATWLLSAAADLRIALEGRLPTGDIGAVGLRVAEVTMRGMVLGQMDAIMTAVKLGWLDKLAEHEIDRARRRSGAAATNLRRATAKQEALGEAIRIAGKNQRLSHEEIAVKVRDSLRLNTTIKTLTDWVREWRRQGYIDERKS